METHARVVVIGGGVTGCAILYHLAKAGWKDVVLLERKELTAGSTWHAAGSLFALTNPSSAAVLQKYTINLYPELEKESGQSCGYHPVGGIHLARTDDQLTALQYLHSRGKRNGIDSEFISLEEAKRLAPILKSDGLKAVLYEPIKGYCDPASVTQAYAKAARDRGAKIYRQTPVTSTRPNPDGTWTVGTPNGDIKTDYIVNAAGLWAREVAALAGITLPLQPVEHHYMVTETIPEIAAMDHEVPNISEPSGGYYCRQEGKGLLLGAYESKCVHWAENGTPLDFGHELLPDDIGRMEVNLARAVEAMPCLESAGIKRIINGPMIFSPDLGPLLGPYPGLKNYFCACGVMSGFNQGGGIGKVLTEWIIEGEPSLDVFFWDVARFGDWAGKRYTRERTKYFYEHRTDLVYPAQEFGAGRPIRTFPIHDRLADQGAVFGFNFGFEYPLWYARKDKGDTQQDQYGFHRGNWFDAVGEECRALREGVGLLEISTFAKYEVTGEGAAAWLDKLLANRMPKSVGKTVLSPMLSPKGRLIGDFTVSRLGEDRFILFGSGPVQRWHMRWFEQNLPQDGSIKVENLSARYCGLHIAGPKARQLLQAVTLDEEVGGNAFPFLSAREMSVGACPNAIVARVSFTGELGYEIYMPAEYQRGVYEALTAAGKSMGLRHVGSRALLSLRVEKGFPSWGVDLSPDYTAYEPGMGRFVRLDKPDFVGKAAAEAAHKAGPKERLATFVVEANGVDCFGGEAIYRDGKLAGYVTSGTYGHTVKESLALGYVKPQFYEDAARFEIELMGKRRPATLSAKPRVDPEGIRMRS
jgi:dimethylglycine dehydrogenase